MLIDTYRSDVPGLRLVHDIARDVRCAVRQLVRAPGVAATIILSMGLAIGVNAALFSVADAVLLRPLPYPEPDRLVRIDGVFTKLPVRMTATGTELAFPLTAPELDEAQTLAAVGAYGVGTANVGDTDPERLTVATVTPAFFEALGAVPVLGRTLHEDDVRDAQRVAVISRRLWAQRYQSATSALGRRLVLNGQSFTVLGVMPDRVDFPDGADVWIAASADPQLASKLAAPAFVARLSAHASPSSTREELIGRLAHREMTRQDPRSPGLTVTHLRNAMVSDVRPALMFVIAAAVLALIAACLNTASLLLTRVAAREREFAIRRAVGASSRRLVRQVSCESLLLAALAAACAVPIALWTLDVARTFVPPTLHGSRDIALDIRAVAVLVLLSLVVSAFIGIAPSLSARGRAARALRVTGTVGEDRRWRWLRSSLVTAQIATAVVILIAASTVVRTVGVLLDVDVGPRHHDAVVFEVTLPRATYPSGDAIRVFHDRLLHELQAVPGLRAAGATSQLPGSTSVMTLSKTIEVDGLSIPETPARYALGLGATPGYFLALGIDILAGRAFTDHDRADGVRTAVVSRGYADAVGLQPSEIVGRRVNLEGPGRTTWAEVVGVVRDVRMRGPESDLQPAVYVPFAQASLNATGFVAVLADGPFEQTASAVRSAVARVDPTMPSTGLRTFGDVRSDYLATRQFTMTALVAFGSVTAALSAVGLFGILSYLVRLRRRELAMRLVLGATPARLRREVFVEGVALAVLGLVLGTACSLASSQVVAAYVPGLQHTDATRVALVCIAVLALSALAVWAPARQAARTDPLVSLRAD